MNGLRGTDVGQDTRFKDKEAISIKNTKFPDHFSQKVETFYVAVGKLTFQVDLRKVNISVLRQWVTEKITELLRFEDDVVVEYAYGLLENKDDPFPDPRKMQVNLTGFMDIYGAAAFMSELWTLLLSAQNTVGGVPAEFIAKKKAELEKAQREGRSVPPGRDQASNSFDNRRDGNGLPSRPGQGGPGGPHDHRRGPPGRFDDRDGPRRGGYGGGRGRDGGFDNRPRDSGYGNRRGDGYGGPPDRGYGRERDNGYGNRGPPPPRNDDRSRPRSRSPPRFKRRSPSLSRSPPPRRRMSPSPRRRSPSPRRRDRSVTPPLRSQPVRRDRDDSATPPRKRPIDREPVRGRSTSRSTPPRKTDRSRSRSRSLSLTPPRRRRRSSSPPPARRRRDSSTPPRHKARNDSTPPRNRRDDSTPPRRRRDDSTPPRRTVRGRSGSRSPSPKRRRASPSRSRSISPPPKREEDVVRKGRGRFTVEDEKDDRAKADKPKKKLEGALAKSKWAD